LSILYSEPSSSTLLTRSFRILSETAIYDKNKGAKITFYPAKVKICLKDQMRWDIKDKRWPLELGFLLAKPQ